MRTWNIIMRKALVVTNQRLDVVAVDSERCGGVATTVPTVVFQGITYGGNVAQMLRTGMVDDLRRVTSIHKLAKSF